MSGDATDQDDPDGSMISTQDAVSLALGLIKNRRLDYAAEVLEHVIKAEPQHGVALNYLGILKVHLGEPDVAVDLFSRAAAALPSDGGVLNNMGNVLVQQGAVDQAVEAYQDAIRTDPDLADPYSNLAAILRSRRDMAGAERLLREALLRNDKNGYAHHNLAGLLLNSGREVEAIEHFWKGAALIPDKSMTSPFLAIAYWKAGMTDKAIAFVRNWVADSPDDPEAKHLLAGFTGENVPERAPDEYVSHLFDNFASSFDAQLDNLDYRAPQLVSEALSSFLGADPRPRIILDAGCGTGKCAKYLRPMAQTLIGVDLSSGMLKKAARTKLYDGLEQAELTAFLESRVGAFDAIVSADTLCYFGKLEAFTAAAADALRPGGVLIYTLEALDAERQEPYVLAHNGRYVHGRAYAMSALAEAGLSVDSCVEEQLRKEGGLPVNGFLITATKPDTQATRHRGA